MSIQVKTAGISKTRAEKSNPDTFNIYVHLAGHDNVIDAGWATT